MKKRYKKQTVSGPPIWPWVTYLIIWAITLTMQIIAFYVDSHPERYANNLVKENSQLVRYPDVSEKASD